MAAKEAKTNKFTFTAADGTIISTLLLEDIAKLEEQG